MTLYKQVTAVSLALLVTTACAAQDATMATAKQDADDNGYASEELLLTPRDVSAEVTSDGAGGYELKLTGGDTSTGDGAVTFEPASAGVIHFELKTAPGVGGNWAFEKAFVCNQPPQSGQKLNPNSCSLKKKQRIQFAASAAGKYAAIVVPAENGVIDLGAIQGSEKHFKLFSANNSKTDYFYRLRACATIANQEVCADSDPKIRNRGRN